MDKSIRYLRVSWTAFCVTASVFIAVLWWRCYYRAYQFTFELSERRAVRLVSNSGYVAFVIFDPVKVPPNRYMKGIYSVEPAAYAKPERWWEAGVAKYPFPHTFVKMPHWFLVLSFALGALFPLYRCRYSLRTLLIAVTIVSSVLGVITCRLR